MPSVGSKVQIARISAAQAVVLALVSGGFGLLGSVVQLKLSAPNAEKREETKTDKKIAEAIDKRSPISLDKALPIGTIVCSIADPYTFSRQTGDDNGFDTTRCVWVPADGRVVGGTPYATTFGSEQVPDLRGLFLRGLNYTTKDNVRTDQYADPDGHRDAGRPQSDELRSHSHPLNDPGHTHGGGVNGVLRSGDNGNELSMSPHNAVSAVKTGITIGDFGGLETRPKNAAVFYYIKIR